MASYIIFIPDAKNETETRGAMDEVGPGDLLDGAQCMHITGHGPNGGHGHLRNPTESFGDGTDHR